MECKPMKKKGKIRANDEDRISNLPDDLIHHILSFIDSKQAVQTSVLSSRWRSIWIFSPYLNLNPNDFNGSNTALFKFVNRFLSHRNNDSDVSTLNFGPSGSLELAARIAKYALSHNTQQLSIDCYCPHFSLSLLNSPFLKHLNLNITGFVILPDCWNFPALTTLHLHGVQFEFCEGANQSKSINLFSKCVNLKNLTLAHCTTGGKKAFNIITPRLESLNIGEYGNGLDEFVVLAPNLLYFTYKGQIPDMIISKGYILPLSFTNGFPFLEGVNIQMWGFVVCPSKEDKHRVFREMVNLFGQLRNTRFLTLTSETVELLAKFIDVMETHACPFINLKCLKLEKHMLSHPLSPHCSDVINYFLSGSPTATLIRE